MFLQQLLKVLCNYENIGAQSYNGDLAVYLEELIRKYNDLAEYLPHLINSNKDIQLVSGTSRGGWYS